MDDEQTRPTSQAKTVGRRDLVKRIAQKAQISQKQASEALDATLNSIQESLQNGDEVRLIGFGSFKKRQSAARQGVHPRDHTLIEIAAKDRVRFSPGKELREAVFLLQDAEDVSSESPTGYEPQAGDSHVILPPRPKRLLPEEGLAEYEPQGGDSHVIRPPRPNSE